MIRCTMLLAAWVCLLQLTVEAAEYHVASAGSDSNVGSGARPFRTIGKASTLLVAGDTCTIHAGVYHETLRPANSGASGRPITYRAAGDGAVTISAADAITGWTNHQGDIWRATMPVNRGGRLNQVFSDGRLMVEARWPNLTWNGARGFDLLDATALARVTATKGSNVLTVPLLNQATNFWQGAFIWAEVGSRWTAQVATITGSAAGSLTVGSKSSPWYPDDGVDWQGNQGALYITGTLAALDAPGEWHVQGGYVYLMTLDRSNPAGHLVEARNGRLVADLSSRDWIVLSGLNGYAGSANLTGTGCVLRNCTFNNISHEAISGYGRDAGGLSVFGTGNLVEGCLIDGSSSNGVNLSGTGNMVRNCIVRNINYNGDYSGGVSLSGDQNTLEYCTITRAGRALINPGGTRQVIRNNDVSYALLWTQDGGAFYSYNRDGQGTEIAYNRIHDNLGWALMPSLAPCDGIYLDDGCLNFIVHHNEIWNCDDGIRLGHILPTHGHRIYNNTLWSNRRHGMAQHGTSSFTDIVVWNNLSDHDDFLGTDLRNNLFTSDAKFVAVAQYDFRLSAGSPAIDAGLPVAGITDGLLGVAPDVGAREYNGVAWTAGATGRVGALSLLGDANSDGVVDEGDQAILISLFGRRSSDAGWNAAADINGDARIDAQDTMIVLRNRAR